MESMITLGVKVNVEPFYQQDQSNPLKQEFFFAYRVTLENHNSFPVKLLSRHWYICESNAAEHYIEGEGVVGLTPTIQPGTTFQYVSGCNLHTEMGLMSGTYLMENLHTHEQFDVHIPKFDLIAPFKLN